MPAFYDGELFTVNMKEMLQRPALIGNNKSINEIYASNDLDEEQDFAVLDAIRVTDSIPVYDKTIVFNAGFTHQFFRYRSWRLPLDPIPRLRRRDGRSLSLCGCWLEIKQQVPPLPERGLHKPGLCV
jgi:hypothetical protein